MIAPTSHCNVGRFFNCPSNNKKSILPTQANLEMVRFCIEKQVRMILKSIVIISKGVHLVWEYNRKD